MQSRTTRPACARWNAPGSSATSRTDRRPTFARSASMYRHLIVPLDDSPLSVETVGRAVDLARALGAKVTFFHARADYGASSIGALERVMSPAAFNENVAGE